jgi:hypothetical protein
MVKSSPGAELTTIAQARAESEARLGYQAAALRRSSAAVAKEALDLPASSFSRPR